MTETRWLDPREERLWRAFLGAGRAVDAAVERQLAGAGLSGPDYAVLASLTEAPDGTLRVRDLCREVSWDRSRMSHHLRRMEKRGLVTRADCPGDARGTLVSVTDAGRTALTDAAPGHVACVRAAFLDRVPADDVERLAAALERVRDGVAPG
ncbi:MarR family winged helix-turn-helix transcriptional regulator [Cellulomonas sp. ATA003]|uniref:MarR family winged helix-turn-helix transcriptional regulator n=1 Tax=Cellulomonas sp. ATA003 TaxID=3073064 RepID=UPI002872BD3D|nr:MarR family winged helix-turn-helix transcriptional regulator [Cellulomonas sp. ATA003]WNB85407.1 MarR family winged helix-turn-helix transcriptional regulator [Cellulomonas sp. ATA003]